MARARAGGVSRLVSRLLGLCLLLLAIVVGVALLVQSRLDQDGLRLRIERDVLRQTGRQLMLGTLHVSLLPVPMVEATDIAFADRPGGARAQMLTASGLQAHLALLPLLSHVVRLEGLTLDRPDILLERSADGTANWQLHKPVVAVETGGPAGGGGHWHTEIDSVRLRGARLGWQDRQRGWSGAVEGLSLDGSGLTGDAPAGILAGSHDGADFRLDVRSGPLARMQPGDGETGAWPVRVRGTVLQAGRETASLDVGGTLDDPARGRGYKLDVSAQIGRTDGLNRLFPHARLPAMQDVALRTQVADASAPDAAHGRPQLERLSVRSGALDLGEVLRAVRVQAPWARGLAVTSLSIDAPGVGSPIAITLGGQWRGQAVAARGTAGTLAGWQGRSQGEAAPRMVPVALDLSVGDAQAHVAGQAGEAVLDLQGTASVPDLRHLSDVGPDLTDLTLSAHVGGGPGKPLTLTDLQLQSRELEMTGAASWLAGPHPVLETTLAVSHADLDALRAGWNSGQAPAPNSRAALVPPQPAPPGPGGQAAPAGQVVPFGVLRLADLSVALDAARLRLGGDVYHDLVGHLSVQGGVLTLAPFSVNGPAGPIAGRLDADANGDRVALSLQPSMIRAETLASLLGERPVLRGVLELVATLHATGATTTALAASATGRAGVSLVDGEIENAALGGVLGRSVGLPGGGETAVRCLALPATLSDGVATIAPLALQTSRLEVQGHGTVGLVDGRLDLHLLPRLSLGATGASLPVHVGGRLGAPEAALDPAAPGGRFALTIGGGPAPDLCGSALQAARYGAPGPSPSARMADRPRKAPKPIDILRSLGLMR